MRRHSTQKTNILCRRVQRGNTWALFISNEVVLNIGFSLNAVFLRYRRFANMYTY